MATEDTAGATVTTGATGAATVTTGATGTATDTAHPTTAERFRAAVENGELAAMEALFTDDVNLYSPVKFTPFEGKPMVMGLFGVLLRTFEDFHYTGAYRGTGETSVDGSSAPSEVLMFRAAIGGRAIHGIDLLHFDEAGLIKEFTVMVRPQSAVHALGAAVLAGLVEAGLAPAPDITPDTGFAPAPEAAR